MTKPKKTTVKIVSDWQPPDPLKLLKKDKKSSYRWIRKNEVELRKQQGWEIVEKSEVGLEKDLRVSRGTTTNVECNELILCKRTNEMNNAHRDYLNQKNKKIMDTLGTQFHQEGERTGVSTYGKVKIENRKK